MKFIHVVYLIIKLEIYFGDKKIDYVLFPE